MVEIKIKNNEIDILLQLKIAIGEKPKIYIEGTGNLLHHLIEGIFEIVDKLAKTESIGHTAEQWRGRR